MSVNPANDGASPDGCLLTIQTIKIYPGIISSNKGDKMREKTCNTCIKLNENIIFCYKCVGYNRWKSNNPRKNKGDTK